MSLSKIQTELNAPKNQFNKFGNYKYRSLEDITDALKPHLKAFNYSLIVSDLMEEIGGRMYVRATAELYDETMKIIAANTAYAREPLSIKGMSEMQITGATSSYARKYALNGLFAIDDNKDADSQDNSKAHLATEDQVLKIQELIIDTATDKPTFLQYFKVKDIKSLSFTNAENAIKTLEKKRRRCNE